MTGPASMAIAPRRGGLWRLLAELRYRIRLAWADYRVNAAARRLIRHAAKDQAFQRWLIDLGRQWEERQRDKGQ